MAEEGLDLSDVSAALAQAGGVGVAAAVGAQAWDAGGGADGERDLDDPGDCERAALPGPERARVAAALVQPGGDAVARDLGDGDGADLVALAVQADVSTATLRARSHAHGTGGRPRQPAAVTQRAHRRQRPPIMPGQQSGRPATETFKSPVPGACTDAAGDQRGAVLQAALLPAVTRRECPGLLNRRRAFPEGNERGRKCRSARF